MAGETSLNRLLAQLRPVQDPVRYGFALVDDDASPAGLTPLMTFREAEGLTLIAPIDALKAAGLSPRFTCRRITLTVHSALEAVGLTAAVSATFAQAGISANVVAAVFHDHVFALQADARRAMAALNRLSARSGDAQGAIR